MLSLKFVKALFYSGPWGIYYRATWALPSSLELRKISHMAKKCNLREVAPIILHASILYPYENNTVVLL